MEKVGAEASCTLALLALHTRGGPGAPSDFPELTGRLCSPLVVGFWVYTEAQQLESEFGVAASEPIFSSSQLTELGEPHVGRRL